MNASIMELANAAYAEHSVPAARLEELAKVRDLSDRQYILSTETGKLAISALKRDLTVPASKENPHPQEISDTIAAKVLNTLIDAARANPAVKPGIALHASSSPASSHEPTVIFGQPAKETGARKMLPAATKAAPIVITDRFPVETAPLPDVAPAGPIVNVIGNQSLIPARKPSR